MNRYSSCFNFFLNNTVEISGFFPHFQEKQVKNYELFNKQTMRRCDSSSAQAAVQSSRGFPEISSSGGRYPRTRVTSTRIPTTTTTALILAHRSLPRHHCENFTHEDSHFKQKTTTTTTTSAQFACVANDRTVRSSGAHWGKITRPADGESARVHMLRFFLSSTHARAFETIYHIIQSYLLIMNT